VRDRHRCVGLSLGDAGSWLRIVHCQNALAPAALSGVVQGLWLYLARNRWSGKKELVWFGIISGSALGLLDCAPAYVTTTACFGWGHIFLFVSAALAGGSSAGYVNSQVHLAEVRSPAPAAWKGRVALGVVLFLCAAGFEYVHYGVRLLERFPALGLSERAVIDLNAGNAQGTARSGNYEYSGQFHRSCVVGSEGGVMEISQNDGKIQVYAADMWLKGGLDHQRLEQKHHDGKWRWQTLAAVTCIRIRTTENNRESLHRDRLCQIPGLIHITPAANCDVIGKKL